MRLAIRSLFRHRARSFISLSAIMFGEVALLLSGGFIAWNLHGMRTATIYSLLGHIQIARPRYFTEGAADPFANLLSDGSRQLDALRSRPEVKIVAPRLNFAGLLSHTETTVSFLGEGIDPDKEEQKTRLVSEREIARFVSVSKGQPLSSSDPKGIILGEGLAATLGVAVGDKVILLVSTSSGSLNAIEATVRGLFFTLSKAYNDVALRVPIQLARELLRISGSHIWTIILAQGDDTDRVVEELRQDPTLRPPELEIRPWYEMADFYNKTERLYIAQMTVLYVIIGLMVVLGIANLMMMSVMERTGEIGTLMALGARRSKVMLMFIQEGIALGGIGALIGLAIGLLLAYIISEIGIPMPPAPGMSHGFTAEILVPPRLITTSTLTAFGTVVLASIYPAWKASRLNIVDALRHNR